MSSSLCSTVTKVEDRPRVHGSKRSDHLSKCFWMIDVKVEVKGGQRDERGWIVDGPPRWTDVCSRRACPLRKKASIEGRLRLGSVRRRDKEQDEQDDGVNGGGRWIRVEPFSSNKR